MQYTHGLIIDWKGNIRDGLGPVNTGMRGQCQRNQSSG